MASIKDVAALAGVSPATVSRVMNGTAKVDPEKKERVMRVIDEIGFVPNEAARTLFRKSAKIIGLIVPSIRNPYFTELTAHIDAMATANGFRPFLCNTGYDPEKEKAASILFVLKVPSTVTVPAPVIRATGMYAGNWDFRSAL